MSRSASGDGALYQRLAAAVGNEHVLVAPDDLAVYSRDLIGVHRGAPACVVRPGSTAEVAAVVRACADAGAGIVPHGGNTGFCGGAMPDASGTQVVVALARLNRIRAVDTNSGTMAVDAGCVLATVREVAARHDRLFPLSHGGEGSSQIGGNLSTNAGGNNVLRYGNARALVLGLEAVLADGSVLDLMRALRKDNTGYDLKQLFIGAEGTLGIVTGAVLKLSPRPRHRATALAAAGDVAALLMLLGRCRATLGETLSAFEIVPRIGLDLHFAHSGEAREPFAARHSWHALIEDEASTATAGELQAVLETALAEGLIEDAVVAQSGADRAALWRLREGMAVAMVADPSILKNDTSVPIPAIPVFLARAAAAAAQVVPGVRAIPFGHAGDGNIHYNLARPAGTAPEAFVAAWPGLVAAVEATALALGGTISAEHGIGRAKRATLAACRGEVELAMMRELKRALDPRGLMNPGKLL